MKIVINSHKAYDKPLTLCLQSLIKTGFNCWDDLVVVVGGCDKDEEHGPELVKLKHLFSKEKPSKELPLPDKIVRIKTCFENLDFTAKQMLYEYKDHELIDSDLYFYTLETITFEKEFLRCFYHHNFVDTTHDIYSTRGCNSNISVFKKDIINKYKDNYKKTLTKKEVVRLEHRHTEVNGVVHLYRFGKVKFLQDREVCCKSFDVYKTGKPRGSVFYPNFGICKYIYFMPPPGSDWTGDFTGKYEG